MESGEKRQRLFLSVDQAFQLGIPDPGEQLFELRARFDAERNQIISGDEWGRAQYLNGSMIPILAAKFKVVERLLL